jgi:beta-glucosidase
VTSALQETPDPKLPDDLEVGVATGAWQVEGAVAERGRCIWDDFAEVPGAIRDGTTGEPACDHLHHLDEDLDRMAWLGVDAYRFSVCWPRVLPRGWGEVSAAGLDVYDRVVDGLLARGIRPVVTLYHWELPSAVQAAGGWPARETAERFADYAEVVVGRLGDRVERWATHNEPWCAAFLGHAAGVHAPGERRPDRAYAAAYHLLLGHGLAVERLRAAGASQVGIVLNVIPTFAANDDETSVDAAEHVDGVQNRLFLDQLAGKEPPADVVAATAGLTDWAFVRDEDRALIGAPLDWVGENYYTVMRVAGHGTDGVDAVGQDAAAFPGAPPMRFVPREPVTEMGWEIEPSGLGVALRQVADALPGVPLWVTENGAATVEDVTPERVHDPVRVEYFRRHVRALLDARVDGLDVRGYYAWSLLDNIEWAEGWTKRFGLIHVDPATQLRTPKTSARWWRDRLSSRATSRSR